MVGIESRTDVKRTNGTIAGYDPGGNNANGFALLRIHDSKPVSISVKTLSNAEAVINEIGTNNVLGLGVDTLSCWSTGRSGWRPADLWLRKRYPAVRNSIMSPNTLSGSMGINGMSVLVEAASSSGTITLSETHPKVLYYALTQEKYDYRKSHAEMDGFLSNMLGRLDIRTSNDHEWDAAISAYALLMGITGAWKTDLHELRPEDNCRIVKPCGKTFFYWPSD
jgi:hypothetical protein